MKKPIHVSLILLKRPLKALMLETSTARWCRWFHLYWLPHYRKNTYSSPMYTEI